MDSGYMGALQQIYADYHKSGGRKAGSAAGNYPPESVSFGNMLHAGNQATAGIVPQINDMNYAAAGTGTPWDRTAERVDPDLVRYMSYKKNPTMAEFTAAYEKSLEIKGIAPIDYAALVKGAGSFADVFSDYQVMAKVGDCSVASPYWQRNDFPFWKYFDEDTRADELNSWRPSGPEPSQLDPEIQKNIHAIGSGRMSILIPEKLQAKMDADPAYAEEVFAKVAKWKTDYDRWDNAAAASLGMDVAEQQMKKSYCLQLDEEGNVVNATITGPGGFSGPTEEEIRQFKAEQAAKARRKAEIRRLEEESAQRRAEQERIELESAQRRAEMERLSGWNAQYLSNL